MMAARGLRTLSRLRRLRNGRLANGLAALVLLAAGVAAPAAAVEVLDAPAVAAHQAVVAEEELTAVYLRADPMTGNRREILRHGQWQRLFRGCLHNRLTERMLRPFFR